MAITAVAGQTANAFTASGTTLNVVLPNRPQRGNLVVLSVAMGIAAFLTSVIDSNGNVYNITPKSPAQFAGAARVYICELHNAPFNASATITANISTAVDLTIHAIEVTGQDNNNLINTEVLHTNDATTSTNINDPTITPTMDNCFLFFGCACDALSVNSPWTTVGSIVNGNIAEYLIQGKAASQAVSITQNNGVWIGVAVAFNAAPTPVVQPARQTADDESGWFSEMTQVSDWWGADISLKGWLDADFVINNAVAQNITGVKFSNTQTFGVSKLSFGLVGVKYVNNQSFGVTTITRGAVTVAGVKFTNTQSFKVAVVTRGAVTVGGVKFTNAQSFGAAVVSKVNNILGVKFANAQSFKNAILTTVFNMTGVKFTNLQSFKVAVVSATYSVSGVKFTNNQTFGAAVVTRGAVTIQGSKFTNAQTFATATVAALLQNVTGARFVNNQTFFNASISQPGAGGTVPNDWMRHTRRLRR